MHGEAKPFFDVSLFPTYHLYESWYGHKFLSGFHKELLIIPLFVALQGIILLKNKKTFQKMGQALDHYRTYIVMLVGVVLTFFILSQTYPIHHVTYYFQIGAYLCVGIIITNIVLRLYHNQSIKISSSTTNKIKK